MAIKSSQIESGEVTLNKFGSRDSFLVVCDYCSKEFESHKHRIQNSWRKKSDRLLFCSGSCANLNRIKKVEIIVNCSNPECQKPIRRTKSTFLGRAFCDNSCAGKVINLGNRNNPTKQRECKSCSSKYYTTKHHQSQRLCVECVQRRFTPDVAKSLTIADYENRLSVKGKHVSWRASHIRLFNRSWNNELQSLPCQQCGYDKHVELAHIRAVKDFPKSATLGEVNDPKNLYVLCRNCHWELDNGHLKPESIKSR